jgi:CBS domain containing-hemolysin-like protein
MAFASAKEEPFLAMASKKVKGAKKAIKLLKNANKVSSFCQDIMGDICGIISGAAGTTAVVVIAGNADATTLLIVSTIISGLIAALTIAGKAATKKIAMKNSTPIIIFVGRILSGFTKDK